MSGIPNATLADVLEYYISNHTVRIALVSNDVAFTLDVDAHDFVDDVFDGGTTAFELDEDHGTASGYSRKTVTNNTFTADDTNDEGVWDTTVTYTWSSLSSTDDIQGALFYIQEGGDDTTPGDDRILLYDDADADFPIVTNGNDFNYEPNTSGPLRSSVV